MPESAGCGRWLCFCCFWRRHGSRSARPPGSGRAAAITVYTFAILTRLTYEDIEAAPLAPYQALCAMGAAPAGAYWRAVVPGIAPSYFSNVLYLLETNVRPCFFI